jgi:hypothetical protein
MTGSVLGLKDAPVRESALRSARSAHFAWRSASWFGALLMLVGLADMALVWYPLRPGNPSWEFGAVDLSFSTLPVLTIGFAALLAATVALGRLRFAMLLGVISILIALVCMGGYLLFLSDVPLALRNSPPEILFGVKKAIFRNSIFGVLFSGAYLAAGIATLRHARAARREAVK